MTDKLRIYTLKKCPKVGPIRVSTIAMMKVEDWRPKLRVPNPDEVAYYSGMANCKNPPDLYDMGKTLGGIGQLCGVCRS